MRTRLYEDRQRLEAMLHEAERTLQRRSLSVPLLSDAVTLRDSLEQFSYLQHVRLTQSDERHLQNRFLAAYNHCEQILVDGVPRLEHELRYAPPAVQRRLEPFIERALPKHEDAQVLQQLAAYRDELATIFGSEHTVSDGSLQRQCIRLDEIVTQVKSRAALGGSAATVAAELVRFAQRESHQLRSSLAEHLGYALVHYPQMLRGAGKSSLETTELIHLYEQDCTTVDRLLSAIAAKAVVQPTMQSSSRVKQLIIGGDYRACDSLERQLQGYGRLERMQFVPYMTLETGEEHARELLTRPRSLFSSGTITVHEAHPYRIAPCISSQDASLWSLDMVQAPQAWDKSRGEGSLVAVIDTGIDYTHPDLSGRFGSVLGVDCVEGSDPMDGNGHGTHVAGTVAGSKTGVAPGATLYAVRVLDDTGGGSEVSVLRGIEWAIEHNVHVINMSLGSLYASQPEAQLIALAASRGIAVACAAGNDGNSSYNYPASHPGAISVAAIDRYKERAAFSNYNDQVDLCAPGLEVYSTWPGGGYRVLAGTSMASPHVAGACALLASSGVQGLEQRLKATAQQLGETDEFGAGLIQVAEAVNGG